MVGDHISGLHWKSISTVKYSKNTHIHTHTHMHTLAVEDYIVYTSYVSLVNVYVYICTDATFVGNGSTALDQFRTVETWIFFSDFTAGPSSSTTKTAMKIPVLSFGDIDFNLLLSAPGDFQLDFSIGTAVRFIQMLDVSCL